MADKSPNGRPGDAPRRPEPPDSQSRQWYRMAGVGFEFIVEILLFGGVGWWLDRKFQTSPWLLLVGLGVGFAAGLWTMIRMARKSFHD